MTVSVSCISDARGLEVVLDDARLPLRASEVGANGVRHLPEIPGTLAPHRVGLDVLIQKLVGVEIGAVPWEPEDADAISSLREPSLDVPRPVHGMTINDQEDRTLRVAQQTLEESPIDPHGKGFPEDHERNATTIRDRGDHVAAKPLTRARDHRRLPTPAIGSPRLMVRAQTHLIAPVNRGTDPPGLASDGRILPLQPQPDLLGISFKRPPQGLLRGQIPPLQIPTHGPDRDPQTKSLPKELLNRFARPKSEGQPKLVRASAHDHPNDQRRCVGRQPRRPRTAPLLRPQSPQPPSSLQPHPAIDRAPGDPEDPRGFGLGHTVEHGFDNPPAEILLRGGRQRTSILNLHGRQYSNRRTHCHLYYAPISNSSATLEYTTLSRNLAVSAAGGVSSAGSSSVVGHSILWGNCAPLDGREIHLDSGSSATFDCSAVDQSGVGGTGGIVYEPSVIFSDPLFCDMGSCADPPTSLGDFYLATGSPCAGGPCGYVGHLSTACGETPVARTTWGAIRAAFR